MVDLLTGNYHIHGQRNDMYVVKAPCYVNIQTQLFQSEKIKETKIFIQPL